MKKQPTATCSPKTAVAYARYSSAGQRDVSIEQQLQDIRTFANREGYKIIHEYADRAKSGFRHAEARMEFQKMLTAARTGRFDTVIVWKTDRFARNREDAAVCKGQLRRSGVRVVSAMEPIPEGSAGVLLEGMLESTAEWYSKALSENVIRGLHDNAKQCLWNGNRVYGYDHDATGHYIINQEEAAIVTQIFDWYRSGWSYASIAQTLNNMCIPNPRGHKWTLSGVYNAIGNERYTGVYIWSDHRTEGGMPAIISREDWEEAQRMRRKTSRHYETGAIDYLLTGKAFCGHCGSAMVGDCGTSKTGARHYYYSCQSHKARKGCEKHSVQKDALETFVLNHILNHVLQEPEIDRIVSAVVDAQKDALKRSPLPAMERELKEVEDQIESINDAIAHRIWSNSTIIKLKALEEQAEAIRDHIAVLKYSQDQLVNRDRVLFHLHRFRKGDRNDPVFRKQIISTFLNAVYVYDDYLDIAINNVEGAERIPLDCLKSSDSVLSGLPYRIHPNSAVTVYRVAWQKKRA